ncbi:hypothetical protein HAX54_006401, partial [Datura stramonium]|nr:hypothetical protein [Datura stramonium]
ENLGSTGPAFTGRFYESPMNDDSLENWLQSTSDSAATRRFTNLDRKFALTSIDPHLPSQKGWQGKQWPRVMALCGTTILHS